MTLQSHRGRTRSSIERCDLAKLQREDRVLTSYQRPLDPPWPLLQVDEEVRFLY